jgi:hypothetical protein
MTIELKLQQVTEQPAGGFAVSVQALRTGSGEVVEKKTYSLPPGANAADLKNLIRPQLAALLAQEARRDQLATVATAALAELMEELAP